MILLVLLLAAKPTVPPLSPHRYEQMLNEAFDKTTASPWKDAMMAVEKQRIAEYPKKWNPQYKKKYFQQELKAIEAKKDAAAKKSIQRSLDGLPRPKRPQPGRQRVAGSE